MLCYGRQSIDSDDVNAVVEVLKSDWLTQGPAIELFEESLFRRFGSQYAVAVANGTAALHLVGLALDWKSDDIVITSPLTFVSTANSILYSGAVPDFVDIEPNYSTIDPNNLEDKIKSYRKKSKFVKAVIGVDFAGHPCNWEDLFSLAQKYEFQLVNDHCHAPGAVYNGNAEYPSAYADAVTLSFHPVKHFTTGEGGAILTNDRSLAERVRLLRAHGITRDRESMTRDDGAWYYEMHHLGFNYRITDFQCALGISQLKKVDKFVSIRREIAEKYNDEFAEMSHLETPKERASCRHAFHIYPLQIDFDKLKKTRCQLFEHMAQAMIALQVHYIPIHLQPYYQEMFGFKRGQFPIAERFYSREVSLPIHVGLEKPDLERVVRQLQRFLVD